MTTALPCWAQGLAGKKAIVAGIPGTQGNSGDTILISEVPHPPAGWGLSSQVTPSDRPIPTPTPPLKRRGESLVLCPRNSFVMFAVTASSPCLRRHYRLADILLMALRDDFDVTGLRQLARAVMFYRVARSQNRGSPAIAPWHD